MESVLFVIARVLFGGFFIYSGINHFRMIGPMAGYAQMKGVPSPKAAVAISGMLLLIGGFSVLLGLYPTVGVTALVLFLVPISFTMHAYWKIQDPQMKMAEKVNFTKNIALLGAALLMLAIPQPWSLGLF
jgi:putative oxidoreductase